jgi:hypothetical protein
MKQETIAKIYVCQVCGYWTDLSYGQAQIDAYNSGVEPDWQIKRQPTLTCQNGCGDMTLVQPTDRLVIRPAIVDAE